MTSILQSVKQFNAPDVCPICSGSGWRIVASNGEKRAARCGCMTRHRMDSLLIHAQIPPRYERCDLANYNTGGTRQNLEEARLSARAFVEGYPLEKTGLLFTGPSGVGKTHLSVAIIRELILKKGILCLFCDYRELLKQIQNSYNPSAQVTELELLSPVFKTEVLVLDDLGAVKPTEWVWDTVSVILNTRYNQNLTTIITTNFLNRPAAKADPVRKHGDDETLGDRIGERMRSRLHEMCRIITLDASDYRKKFRTPEPAGRF